ncbi:hemerythrin domain-containing protein [Streptomyces sp. NPDC002536]
MARDSDVIKELETDHRALEGLFDQFHRTRLEDTARETLLDDVTAQLMWHSAAEQQYLYPAVREFLPQGPETAEQEITDQTHLTDMVRDLESSRVYEPGFDGRVRALEREIAQHISHEEHVLFPRLRQSCPVDTLDELGTEVRRARASAARAG